MCKTPPQMLPFSWLQSALQSSMQRAESGGPLTSSGEYLNNVSWLKWKRQMCHVRAPLAATRKEGTEPVRLHHHSGLSLGESQCPIRVLYVSYHE